MHHQQWRSNEKSNLEENLFGGADSKFVTRNQLAKLANLVSTNMRVLEEYQIPEEKFSDEFIDTIIKNSGEKLQNIDFREALGSLSTFATDFKGDLKANLIYNEYSKVFTIEKSGDMKHIIVSKNEDINFLLWFSYKVAVVRTVYTKLHETG